MHIKAKREFHDDMGKVTEGQVVEVDDAKGADLIRLGLAENIQEAAGKGKPGPTASDPSKSQTGAATQPSSSPAAPAPQTSTSPAPAAGPASSSSTTAGASAGGQTSSTPATAPGGKQKKARKGSKG